MATSEERRLQAKVDAIEAELDRRRTPSQRQADQILGITRDAEDGDEDRRQARRVVRGASGWTPEESANTEPTREDLYRAFEKRQAPHESSTGDFS